jgi:hypothetical protein
MRSFDEKVRSSQSFTKLILKNERYGMGNAQMAMVSPEP